jgi:hypothetical protein
MQVTHVALLALAVITLQFGIELGQCAAEVAAARFTDDEEVSEVGQQTTVVRRDDQTTVPAAEPGAQPGHGEVVEVFAGFVEEYDLRAGVASVVERCTTQLAQTERLRALIGLRDEVALTASEHAAGIRLGDARQDGEQRRLPDAITPDQRDVLTFDLQV